MSKRYNIRWTEADDKEVKRVVRNFNAKIDRLSKKDPQNKNALPDKISVGQIKELIDTRQDLKRELNSLKRFSVRGAEQLITIPDNEYNLKATKWQIEDMSRRKGIVNRKRKKRLQEIEDTELYSGSEKLGYTRGQLGMGEQDKASLRPTNAFTPKMTRDGFKKKHSMLRKESQSTYFDVKDEQLRQNYIAGLLRNYNPNDPNIQEVVDAIENMSFKEFYQIWKSQDAPMEFASAYPNQQEYNAYVSRIQATWLPKKKPKSNPKSKKGKK